MKTILHGWLWRNFGVGTWTNMPRYVVFATEEALLQRLKEEYPDKNNLRLMHLYGETYVIRNWNSPIGYGDNYKVHRVDIVV
jgi:hypothetical protein